jgi:hypothetical protein
MLFYFGKDKATLISISVVAFVLLLLLLFFFTMASIFFKAIVHAQLSSLEEQQPSTGSRGGGLSINRSLDAPYADEVISHNTVTTGSFGDDRITGSNTSDIIIGLLGADTIRGGSGDDKIQGNEDLDKLHGDTSNDLLQMINCMGVQMMIS